jgi:gamma-glutamyltranspeptidase / glutathione hydrolase
VTPQRSGCGSIGPARPRRSTAIRTAIPAVAAGHPVTLEAAAGALRAGGNAFDAAVAAGFAASVAEPVLSSLGGGGFLLARTAGGDEILFDFFVDSPGRGVPEQVEPQLTPVTLAFGAADQVFHVGHGSVAVPGCLAGYLHLHRRLGRLDLATLVAPAARAAREGIVLGPDQAAVARLVDPILSLTAAGRARFHPGGAPLAPDATVRDEPLAALLDDVGAGRVTSFGDAEVAATIERRSREAGGLLTVADLAAYQVHERDPLRLRYRDALLTTNPPPSSGATLIARALAALEAGGDPAPSGTPAELVRRADALAAMSHRPPAASRGTTHVSVVDAEGNLAAMTTSNGSGSGVHLGDTGVLANNIMGEEDLHPDGLRRLPAGRRIGSMMAPSILDRSGRPTVALGSGGSERIRSAIGQVVAQLVDHDASLAAAVEAPRIHLDPSGTVQVEPGFAHAAVEALAARRPVNAWSVTDLYFGGVHAVATDGQHAGDPRRGGCSTRA